MYTLIDLKGAIINGSVYYEELQKVNYQGDDKELFAIKEILERKGHLVKVRWRGYSSKFDSWIPKSSIEPIK